MILLNTTCQPSQLESNVPKPDVPNSTDATVDADGNVVNIGDPVGGYEGAQAWSGGLNAAGGSSAPRYTHLVKVLNGS